MSCHNTLKHRCVAIAEPAFSYRGFGHVATRAAAANDAGEAHTKFLQHAGGLPEGGDSFGNTRLGHFPIRWNREMVGIRCFCRMSFSENRFPLFRDMLWGRGLRGQRVDACSPVVDGPRGRNGIRSWCLRAPQ